MCKSPAALRASLLIFFVGFFAIESHTNAAPAGNLKPDDESIKQCQKSDVTCVNNCRNGETLPIGSKKSAINKCDNKCDAKLARCLDTSMSLKVQKPKDQLDSGSVNQGTSQ